MPEVMDELRRTESAFRTPPNRIRRRDTMVSESDSKVSHPKAKAKRAPKRAARKGMAKKPAKKAKSKPNSAADNTDAPTDVEEPEEPPAAPAHAVTPVPEATEAPTTAPPMPDEVMQPSGCLNNALVHGEPAMLRPQDQPTRAEDSRASQPGTGTNASPAARAANDSNSSGCQVKTQPTETPRTEEKMEPKREEEEKLERAKRENLERATSSVQATPSQSPGLAAEVRAELAANGNNDQDWEKEFGNHDETQEEGNKENDEEGEEDEEDLQEEPDEEEGQMENDDEDEEEEPEKTSDIPKKDDKKKKNTEEEKTTKTDPAKTATDEANDETKKPKGRREKTRAEKDAHARFMRFSRSLQGFLALKISWRLFKKKVPGSTYIVFKHV